MQVEFAQFVSFICQGWLSLIGEYMYKSSNLPSVDFLRECFHYDLETGKLFWREDRPLSHFSSRRIQKTFNGQFAGKEAGTDNGKGYKRVSLKNKLVLVHKIIWAMTYDKWPEKQIDHIDHDRSNNRLENLREVSHKENHRNMSFRSDNVSGITGVYKRGNKWSAEVKVDGKKIALGCYANKDDAAKVVLEARREAGYHPNHGI